MEIIYHVHVGKLVRQLWDGETPEGPKCIYEGPDLAMATTEVAEISATLIDGDSAALFIVPNPYEQEAD
jgi:hypothetical protein